MVNEIVSRICTLVAALTVSGSSPSVAATLQIEFELSISSEFDYLSGSYQPVNLGGPVIVEMDIGELGATDYGMTTVNEGQRGSARFSTPLTSLVGADPYGGGFPSAYAYSFPNVSDYPSTFIEEVAAQENAYSPSGNRFWSYHVEFRVDRRSAPRSGIGQNDYAMDLDDILSVLAEWSEEPSRGYFNESWQIFDGASGVSLAGKSWSDYSPALNRVLLDNREVNLGALPVTPVPAPAAGFLLLTAIGCFGAIARRRSLDQDRLQSRRLSFG